MSTENPDIDEVLGKPPSAAEIDPEILKRLVLKGINVFVDERGDITVHPDPAYADFEEKLSWFCKYPFAVHLGYESMLEKIVYQSEEIALTKDYSFYRITATVTYNPDSAGRKFQKYSVAVCKEGKVYMSDPGLGVPRK